MAKTYHNESPYYDDYNPSKGYTQILAVPGRVEQAGTRLHWSFR